MKNLALILSFLLLGCEEEPIKGCYICTLEMRTTGAGNSPTVTQAQSERCGITSQEAREIEEAGTSTTTASSGGVTVTQRNTMICRKR